MRHRAIHILPLLLLLGFPSVSRGDVTAGLVAWYPFSGNANDGTAYRNHGTVRGATLTTDRSGKPNEAYRFNGSSQWIEVPHASQISNLYSRASFSLWVSRDASLSTPPTLLAKGTSGTETGQDYAIWVTTSPYGSPTGRMAATFAAPGGDFASAATPDAWPLLGWHHLAVTFYSGTVCVYLDGSLKGCSSTPLIPNVAWSYSSLAIGRLGPSVDSGYFAGALDDVRVYDRVLSAAEVLELAGGSDPGPCAADVTTLCLFQGRFKVQADYRDYGGNAGPGKAKALTADSGYFWFFDAANVELVAKIVNSCGYSPNMTFYASGFLYSL